MDRFSDSSEEISVLTLLSASLRWRRRIAVLAIVGALIGLATGLLSHRMYTSEAILMPQGTEASQVGGLAAAASQFGIHLPGGTSSGESWGPPVYVRLLRSRTLLQPIVMDTVVVAEEGGRRVQVLDLLDVSGEQPSLRIDAGVQKLEKAVKAAEDKDLGSVNLSVTTRWPSVSQKIAQQLIDAVNRFNIEKRQSQASAEFRFVQSRAAEAAQALRDAESQLQQFRQQNRVIANSPELSMAEDRLQREVALRQQIYTSLLQSREEARIREVRDAPVITVLEQPQLPARGEPRKSVQKAILGAFLGTLIGLLLAFLSDRLARARRAPSDEARAFFDLVDAATPRLLRRSVR